VARKDSRGGREMDLGSWRCVVGDSARVAPLRKCKEIGQHFKAGAAGEKGEPNPTEAVHYIDLCLAAGQRGAE